MNRHESTDRRVTRRDFLGRVGAGTAAWALAGALPRGARAGAAKRPPNFVVIMTDDQGYQDLGCFGSPDIKTPHLDKMAAEGAKLTSFYSASPICSPARSALMTGCYPKRVGLAQGVLWPTSTTGLNPDEITVAEVLKTRGYATACIGKWHLGHLPPFVPTSQGFDRYFGVPYSNDMGRRTERKKGVPLMRNEEVVEYPAEQATLTERYTVEACSFVESHKDEPFFLYLPHTMPHLPLHVSEKFAGKSAGGAYGDVIECIDWGVGEIRNTLEKHGLAENTYVLFFSDNGPWLSRKKGQNVGSADPLRGGKGSTWEGGMRVPFVGWAPGRIPAGTTSDEVANVMDILPTLAALAGAEVPKDRIIDGHNIRPLLERAGAASPTPAFFYYSGGGDLRAVRAGPWKLHRKKEGPELYNLKDDVGETTNVAEAQPQIVARLSGAMTQFEAHMEKTSRPIGRVSE